MNYKLTFLLLPFLLTACAVKQEVNEQKAHAAAEHATGNEHQQIREMMNEIIRDNKAFAKKKGTKFFKSFENKQSPRVTVVGCADSRVQSTAFDSTPENDIFFVRNIGNQLASNEGSIEYGVEHLHTPLLMFVGHSGCGAVKAASGDYSSLTSTIQTELNHLQLEKHDKVTDELLHKNVITNVHNQVAKAYVKFKHLVDSGKLKIIGTVYDFQNKFGQGYGKLVIVNVNTEKDDAKVKTALHELKK